MPKRGQTGPMFKTSCYARHSNTLPNHAGALRREVNNSRAPKWGLAVILAALAQVYINTASAFRVVARLPAHAQTLYKYWSIVPGHLFPWSC